MKCKIVIETFLMTEKGEGPFDYKGMRTRAEVWSGELELKRDDEYLSKISIIAEGEEHPICDVPFALDIGYWQWVPPSTAYDSDDDDGGTP
jgi:hypothetical protein